MEYVFAAGGRKISSVLTGLEREKKGKASTIAVGPGFDRFESATTQVDGKGSNRPYIA